MKFFHPVWFLADLLWALTCRGFAVVDDALDIWGDDE